MIKYFTNAKHFWFLCESLKINLMKFCSVYLISKEEEGRIIEINNHQKFQ